MSEAHDAGDIDVTIDTNEFEGEFRHVTQKINQMVAGHIAVKKKAMAVVAEFGRGNFDAALMAEVRAAQEARSGESPRERRRVGHGRLVKRAGLPSSR